MRPTQCQVCGQYGRVEEHHISTRGAGGEETVFLCCNHHRLVHDKGGLEVDGVMYYGDDLRRVLREIRNSGERWDYLLV